MTETSQLFGKDNCTHHHGLFPFLMIDLDDSHIHWCHDMKMNEKCLTYLLYIVSHVSTVQLMTPASKNSMCHKAGFYFQSVVVVCSGHRTGLVGEHGWPKMVYTSQTKRLHHQISVCVV